MIDDISEPGAWAKALQAPCTYRTVSEYPGAPIPARALGTTGAAENNPLAAPVLSDLRSSHN